MFNSAIIKRLYIVIFFSCLAIAISGCSGANSTIDEVGQWEIIDAGLPAALISIWGSSVDDIWVVGADSGDGIGPMVLHREKGKWSRINTGRTGDLWWVFGFDEGPIFMGGENGMILRKDGDVMKLMETPGRATVYGIWGASPNDLWAVGGNVIDGGFVWRYKGDKWVELSQLPESIRTNHSMFKVWGNQSNDVWIIGTGGVILNYKNGTLLDQSGVTNRTLFTIHGNDDIAITVGGSGEEGKILEYQENAWKDIALKETPHIIGVRVKGETSYAVGIRGTVLERDNNEWRKVNTGITLSEAFHSVWIDSEGGVWAVGGKVLAPPLVDGVMIYRAP
jgi:hypothetical protein|tara:strand:+ start:41835 stop:42842 length:1008 start_codon:yes stop_codon:yes gene_type:complete